LAFPEGLRSQESLRLENDRRARRRKAVAYFAFSEWWDLAA